MLISGDGSFARCRSSRKTGFLTPRMIHTSTMTSMIFGCGWQPTSMTINQRKGSGLMRDKVLKFAVVTLLIAGSSVDAGIDAQAMRNAAFTKTTDASGVRI